MKPISRKEYLWEMELYGFRFLLETDKEFIFWDTMLNREKRVLKEYQYPALKHLRNRMNRKKVLFTAGLILVICFVSLLEYLLR